MPATAAEEPGGLRAFIQRGIIEPLPLNTSALLEHLHEQLDFIDSSCFSFDAGAKHEAKRLATHVRVLLHDTPRSTSLLAHMELKEGMEFTEGVPAHVLEAARRANGAGTFPGLAVIEISGGGARFVPTFRALPLGSVTLPFDPWWTEQRMFDPQGNAVSRKQIVTWLANKDGGAHIDELPPTYEALSRNGSMGLTYDPAGDDAGTCPSPIPAAMRQIAEEVRISVRRRIPEREA